MANKKRKRQGKKKSILPLIIVVLLAVILTLIAFKMMSTDIGRGTAGESITVDIPEGSNVDDIAQILEENNVIDSAAHLSFCVKSMKRAVALSLAFIPLRAVLIFILLRISLTEEMLRITRSILQLKRVCGLAK